METEFTETFIYWRGPAPWYFVPVPDEKSREIRAIADIVTYGWGVIPVIVRIGATEFETSLFPKDDRYLVPVKVAVRKAENLNGDETVTVHLKIVM